MRENIQKITKNIGDEALTIIPLGGVGEIGKNMIVLEGNNDIIVVDAGVAFASEELLGVDLVIQDISYLQEREEKVRGIFITHGHEDHIGALPYILKTLNVPVYGTRLTIGLIKKKLDEVGLSQTAKLIEINPDESIKSGVFTTSFFRVNHSIPDGIGLIIDTPQGIVIHSGDFKLDHTPVDGKITELNKLSKYGESRNVLALVCDSTAIEREGYTPSERVVGVTFEKEFDKAEGRIIIATFASNVHRIQQVVTVALSHNRKIAVVGRSMVNVIDAAMELGYITCPEGTFIEIEKIEDYSDHELVILTTGSQGEPMSALTRIANGSHRQINILPTDTVIISATPIPGNAKYVYRTINNIFKSGARVVYKDVSPVHVSGHASQEEIKLIINLLRPKFVIPFHGEYRHLVRFSQLAYDLGIPYENTILSSIGDKIVFDADGVRKQGRVPAGSIYIDGLGVGDVGTIVLRDRKQLGEDGIVIVVLTMDKNTGVVVAGPNIMSRGFIYIRESEKLMAKVERELERVIDNIVAKNIREWSKIKEEIKRGLSTLLFAETKRKPVILPIINEVVQ